MVKSEEVIVKVSDDNLTVVLRKFNGQWTITQGRSEIVLTARMIGRITNLVITNDD